MNRQLTLAVIGHVDHGKTALVRALTGIETDRLAEEQARGLSIVLGFSYLERSNGGMIDFIDAPGHEDFVRTMISGATGVDGALLIVAANESVMPQTREHLDIAQLLGLDRGIIVINKTDLVDDEELEIAEDEVRDLVANTFLHDAPLVRTSAITPGGVEALKAALEGLEPVGHAQSADDAFFLPVDRAFVMRGFGPVVTGTLRGGSLTTDSPVEVLPGRISATIRGIQVHNAPVERAHAGQRVAVNLRNVKIEQLRRGYALAAPGVFDTSRRIDAELELLATHTAALRNGAVVRFLIGTSEAMATVRLLDCEQIEPGGRGLVQLRLDREVVTPRTERFIVRSYSPARTLGGGRVLDANAERHKRFDPETTSRLATIAEGTATEMVRERLLSAGARGIGISALGKTLEIDEAAVAAALESIDAAAVGDKYFDSSAIVELRDAVRRAVEAHHEAHPRQLGAALASILSGLGDATDREAFQHAVDTLVAEDVLERNESLLRVTGFDPLAGLSARERAIANEIEQAFLHGGLATPAPDQILGRDKVKHDLFRLLNETGKLVRLKTMDRHRHIVLHQQTLDGAVETLRKRFAASRGFTMAEARDTLGSTRKYVVPLMEHLDTMGVTIRKGDLRQIRS